MLDDLPKGYFAKKVIRVEPLNLQSYITNFNIDFLSVVMEVGFNERNNKRWISLKTQNGTVLLRRTFIDVGRQVNLNNNAWLLGLNYYVTIEPKSKYLNNGDVFDWKDNYYITFVGNRTEVEEFIYDGHRQYTVGN